ncbi:hypothetical protein [Allocoleopsis franciscana]|uniref:Uncharacterized protein n=1 Tax=Allocoleopsis franciscana PCC 7113 TaxID=1173027 RepID=K9WFJ8_9CYAN|nr:hypothetical protein [Allocoleopsis franciscana]AFZ18544.1 hypothetical protein Mic7113_2760 [Allocoleopsis franciscana PCC 7113]
MAINYPIIETQLRLIRALQKGYAEALEAGDWQAADYRAAHLHKLCEGLHHLSQLLDKGRSVPDTGTLKNRDSWLNSIRSAPTNLSLEQPLIGGNPPVGSPPSLPEIEPDQLNDEWRNSFQRSMSTSVDDL